MVHVPKTMMKHQEVPNKPEEYISFQTLIIQIDQDTVIPQHTL